MEILIFLLLIIFFVGYSFSTYPMYREHFYEFQVPESITIRDMFARSDRHMKKEFGYHINTIPINSTFVKDGKVVGGPICR